MAKTYVSVYRFVAKYLAMSISYQIHSTIHCCRLPTEPVCCILKLVIYILIDIDMNIWKHETYSPKRDCPIKLYIFVYFSFFFGMNVLWNQSQSFVKNDCDNMGEKITIKSTYTRAHQRKENGQKNRMTHTHQNISKHSEINHSLLCG